MPAHLLLSGAGLLLVLCLQLMTNNAQEDTNWKVLTMDLQMQSTAQAGEEVPVTLRIHTEIRECMVIKAYLRSSIPLEGPSHSYTFTACLCNDYPRTFFWDIVSNYTVTVVPIVDVVRELNICPEDRAVMPIKANRFYTSATLFITQ
ncbi:PREDICTED: prolactin-inducible protein homolog [Chrysochloris asiatica]|uniref:Prolactin-induced protein n=1 Tax=Chrysochloris asiatica TaxID=185453 RepID=A0A9B0TC45_CHRAS|nr:PREDICTED: prolactin-inducible protein homolog [Chrysochloris asiatica]